MTTTRQKVLTYFKKTRTASVREVARALKLSAPNVRHHLGILVSDGRLELSSLDQGGIRGRPQKIYSLSQSALGDNLPILVDALITVAGPGLKVEGIASFILDPSQFANLPIPRRLALLIGKLNEMHYLARWEASAEGPRVIFGRCPYAKIIGHHPELCRMDSAILEGALGRPVGRIEKTESNAAGACPFAFRVG